MIIHYTYIPTIAVGSAGIRQPSRLDRDGQVPQLGTESHCLQCLLSKFATGAVSLKNVVTSMAEVSSLYPLF